MNSERPDNLQEAAHALHMALQAGTVPAPVQPIAERSAQLQAARARLERQSSASVKKLRDGFVPLANSFAEIKYTLEGQVALFERELRNQRMKRALLAPVLAVLVSLGFVGVAVGLWFAWPSLQSFMVWLLNAVGNP